MENPRYLGDGVYAEFDGYQIVLKANDHLHPTDIIALEPSVMSSLLRFNDEIKELIKAGG